MYTLKNVGASTDPWGRPLFKIRFRLTWLPRNTRKFRWLIRLAIHLIVVRHLMVFDDFIMNPACQTVSYAALGSISTAPVSRARSSPVPGVVAYFPPSYAAGQE